MFGIERDEERGRALLLTPQLITWFFLVKLIMLVRSQWRGVLNYQAHSVHHPLPLGAQDSQHMMMIGVCPNNTKRFGPTTENLSKLIVLLSWSVPSYFAKCGLRRIVWWITGVVDMVVAGFLITALVKNAQYFPTTSSHCANDLGSEPIGKLFAYLALEANKHREDHDAISTRGSVCQDYLSEWVYVIMIRYVIHSASFGRHLSLPDYSYTWTIPSILGILGLSWKPTIIIFMLAFSPAVLALGMGFGILALGFSAAMMLRRLAVWLYPYVSPPIKWILWYLSWPLRITWFALKDIVPSFRYMARMRLKWILMEESGSPSLDLEKGQRHTSSSKAFLRMVGLRKSRIESHPNFSMRSLASGSPTQKPRQASDAGSSTELLSNASPTALICGHGSDWHCRTCENQACFQCSVEISESPSTTQHFFCEPRCSRCYLNTMCGVLPAKKQKPCSHRQGRCKTLPKPRVCRSCSENRGSDVLLRRLEEQEREELLHLARHNLKCGVCESRLRPRGPRWWTCCDCNQECNSDLHPPWSKIPE